MVCLQEGADQREGNSLKAPEFCSNVAENHPAARLELHHLMIPLRAGEPVGPPPPTAQRRPRVAWRLFSLTERLFHGWAADVTPACARGNQGAWQ